MTALAIRPAAATDLAAVLDLYRHLQPSDPVLTSETGSAAWRHMLGHPGLMSHASLPAQRRAELKLTDNLVRLSVGIEDVQDLIRDLDQALAPI